MLHIMAASYKFKLGWYVMQKWKCGNGYRINTVAIVKFKYAVITIAS